MGGGFYDRSVEEAAGTQAYSAAADKTLRATRSLQPELSPFERMLKTDVKSPIVIALDVTGSMGKWAKVIYDKLPMFYGQIMLQGYLEEPAISFAAIGDAYADDTAPLQVTDFAQGTNLDEKISKVYLEGGGGGNDHESYELAAYYYTKRCKLHGAKHPFMFMTGDEGFYSKVEGEIINKVLGHGGETVSASSVFQELLQKYNFYFIKKPYVDDVELDKKVTAEWKSLLGNDHVLELDDPKAVVDLMLGTIAIVTKSRTVAEYTKDMQDRGQSEARIAKVLASLAPITPAPSV